MLGRRPSKTTIAAAACVATSVWLSCGLLAEPAVLLGFDVERGGPPGDVNPADHRPLGCWIELREAL